MTRTYQIIASSAWMNESGYGIHHTPIGSPKSTVAAAIRHGIHVLGHDDFNIGVLDNGRLIDVRWMDESVGNTPEELAAIASEIGVRS